MKTVLAGNEISVTIAPIRQLATIDIPYENYVIRISRHYTSAFSDGSTETKYGFDNNISILRKNSADVLVDVTSEFFIKFNESDKIKVTGDNLFKIIAVVFNKVEQ